MSELSILVISCDKYSDLWKPFWEFKEKYWNDCKYQFYWGSNYIKNTNRDVINLSIGEDGSWADNVRLMLDRIDTPYVIILLEDFFIDKKIDSKKIQELLQYTIKNDIDCLRLEPVPGPIQSKNKELGVGDIVPGSPYYVNTQPSIWRKSVLQSLLIPGYSAWEFELNNSAKSLNFTYKFEGTMEFVFHHKNAVERGKYYKSTVQLLEKNSIEADVDRRGVIDDLKVRAVLSLKRYRVYIWAKTLVATINYRVKQ